MKSDMYLLRRDGYSCTREIVKGWCGWGELLWGMFLESRRGDFAGRFLVDWWASSGGSSGEFLVGER